MNPLFIPLNREHFVAFRDGTKTNMEEFRPHWRQWNAKNCFIGRRVVLSLGYGKQQRLFGWVRSFRLSDEPKQRPEWRAIYGDKHDDKQVACIGIELDGKGVADCRDTIITEEREEEYLDIPAFFRGDR